LILKLDIMFNKVLAFLIIKTLVFGINFNFILNPHENKCFSDYITKDVSITGEIRSNNPHFWIHIFDFKGKMFYK